MKERQKRIDYEFGWMICKLTIVYNGERRITLFEYSFIIYLFISMNMKVL